MLSEAPVSGPEGDRRQADRGGDGESGGRADRTGVGRHAHDHHHQEGGQDDLDQRARGRPRRVGWVAPRSAGCPGQITSSRSAAAVAPEDLRGHVGPEVARGQVPGAEEAEADAGVEVRARNVAQRGDRGEQHEEEHQPDADHPDRARLDSASVTIAPQPANTSANVPSASAEARRSSAPSATERLDGHADDLQPAGEPVEREGADVLLGHAEERRRCRCPGGFSDSATEGSSSRSVARTTSAISGRSRTVSRRNHTP